MPVPNLDTLSADDLRCFASRRLTRKQAADLLGSTPARYTCIAKDLQNYAWNKLTAMNLRATGNITSALSYEEICEEIYAKLPAIARW